MTDIATHLARHLPDDARIRVGFRRGDAVLVTMESPDGLVAECARTGGELSEKLLSLLSLARIRAGLDPVDAAGRAIPAGDSAWGAP